MCCVYSDFTKIKVEHNLFAVSCDLMREVEKYCSKPEELEIFGYSLRFIGYPPKLL